MRGMEENEAHQEDEKEITNMNIQQFIEATRQYLFEIAAVQPVLAVTPARQDR